jgi:3-deoxy-manno-octulosonate cytidylyltransferase (CMP-KDO synthetase)
MSTSRGCPRFAIVIPARFQSTRFPGKPLATLQGATGIAKLLIQRSWEAAAAACDPDRIWVATDDAGIAEAVRAFGGQAITTSSDCRNGTERCAEAAAQIPDCPDILVNLQGDAPLTPTSVIETLATALDEEPAAAMATPAVRCSPSTYDHLQADSAAGRVGGTTVVFNRSNQALYFSKCLLPHIPEGTPSPHMHVHLHLGLYAYRRSALLSYAAAAPSELELLEGLEQLRFLDQGQLVKILPLDSVGWDCIELNNPSDVPAVEAVLRQQGIE